MELFVQKIFVCLRVCFSFSFLDFFFGNCDFLLVIISETILFFFQLLNLLIVYISWKRNRFLFCFIVLIL